MRICFYDKISIRTHRSYHEKTHFNIDLNRSLICIASSSYCIFDMTIFIVYYLFFLFLCKAYKIIRIAKKLFIVYRIFNKMLLKPSVISIFFFIYVAS